MEMATPGMTIMEAFDLTRDDIDVRWLNRLMLEYRIVCIDAAALRNDNDGNIHIAI